MRGNAIGVSAAAVAALAGFSLSASEFQLQDGGFEDVHAKAWTFDRGAYRIEPAGGRNGTKALLFDNGKASEVFQRVRVQGGMRYKFGVWTRTENLVGKGFGVRMCVVWLDKDGKEIDGFYKSPHITGDNNEWRLCSGTAPAVAPDNAVWAKVRPEVVGPVTGRAWLDDAYFEPWDSVPVAGVYSSAYRDEQHSGKVTFVAAINDVDPAADVSRLRHEFAYVGADGKRKSVLADSFTRASAELTIDVKDLPVGRSMIGFRLVDADGKELGRAGCPFVRSAEKRHRRVDFDRLGRTLVDGKPFFPLGMYWSVGYKQHQGLIPKINEKTIAEYAKGPFNCVLPYAQLDRGQMDMVHSNGLMVVRSLLFDFADAAWDPTGKDPEHRYPEAAKKTIEELRDHPGLLAWYVNDERSLSEIVNLRGRLTTVKELDPDHPTLTVLYQIESLRDYMGSFDILGTDPYPIGHYHISTAYKWANAARRATLGVRPLWQIPQAMDWAPFHGTPAKTDRMPTREEMRNMTWQQIAAGANGLIYYSYTYMMLSPTTPFEKAWADIRAVAGEVRDNFGILLSDGDPPSFACDNAKVVVRTWRQDGRLFVLAVNVETSPQKARVSLPMMSGKAQVRFGSASVRAVGKTLSFDLPAIGQALVEVK